MTPPAFDASRRRFFRSLAGDVITGAVEALGAVGALRAEIATGTTTYLADPPREAVPERSDPAIGGAAFRWADPATLLVVDQRALPGRSIEVSVQTASEAAWAIRDRIVAEGPVAGLVAALGLSLTATRSRSASASVLGALLEGSANALRSARPTDQGLARAVDRMLERYRLFDEGTSGDIVASALRREADVIVEESADDHGHVAEAGSRLLSDVARPLCRVLTHGATGPLATGHVGSAVGAILAAHRAGSGIQAWVDETRPGLEGARITAWELARGGVPYTLVADAAAGHLIASGRVDAIVVGARLVAANGDVISTTGTYPLAVLAARHGVPFYVCAPLSSVDSAAADGTRMAIPEGERGDVSSIGGLRVAPLDTPVTTPASDVTPGELIVGIVTDEGVIQAPYREALEAAIARRSARRSLAAPSR